MRIAIGADHAGFEMKRDLAGYLAQGGHEVIDLGTHSTAPVDYPDIAEAVATAVRNGQADRGIIVCGSGAGVSVAASKFPGIRAAVCHDCLHRASGRRARRPERPLPGRARHRARARAHARPTRSWPRPSPAKSATCAAGEDRRHRVALLARSVTGGLEDLAGLELQDLRTTRPQDPSNACRSLSKWPSALRTPSSIASGVSHVSGLSASARSIHASRIGGGSVAARGCARGFPSNARADASRFRGRLIPRAGRACGRGVVAVPPGVFTGSSIVVDHLARDCSSSSGSGRPQQFTPPSHRRLRDFHRTPSRGSFATGWFALALPALVLRRARWRLFFRHHHLAQRENRRPVEVNIRMLIFDGADGIFVERRAAEHDAGRGAIPVQQPGTIARLIGVQEEGVFESAAVAGQPEEWHGPCLAPLPGLAPALAWLWPCTALALGLGGRLLRGGLRHRLCLGHRLRLGGGLGLAAACLRPPASGFGAGGLAPGGGLAGRGFAPGLMTPHRASDESS